MLSATLCARDLTALQYRDFFGRVPSDMRTGNRRTASYAKAARRRA